MRDRPVGIIGAPLVNALVDGGRISPEQFLMHPSGASGLRVLAPATALGGGPAGHTSRDDLPRATERR